MLSLIVAMDQQGLIGNQNTLPWYLPADLQFFKETTIGHIVIMGRKTFESIGRPLPNRRNIVLTRNKNWKPDVPVEIFFSIQDVLTYLPSDVPAYVIGGANLYKQALPFIDEMLITKIDYVFKGDTFFPDFSLEDWQKELIQKGKVDEKNQYPHAYWRYTRKLQEERT